MRRFLTVALLALAAAVLLPAAPAVAQGTGAVGVSVPTDPVQARPGERVQLPLRITNPSDQRLQVRVEQRALTVGSEGRVELLDGPDPRWRSQLVLPLEPLDIPAQGYRDLALPLDTPHLAPDTYLVGILVTPLVADPGVRVVNAVGAYIPVDVPGPRDRRLHATLATPSVVWGGTADVAVAVRNTGASSLYFWGEHGRTRIEKMLLPTQQHRTIPVSIHQRFGIGRQRLSVRLYYNRTDAQVSQITLTRTVIFVHPAYPAVAAGLLAAALARRLRRRQPRPVLATAATARYTI